METEVTEAEMVKLVNSTIDTREPVSFSFGPGWAALKEEESPKAAELLHAMRGESNENCEGAGI